MKKHLIPLLSFFSFTAYAQNGLILTEKPSTVHNFEISEVKKLYFTSGKVQIETRDAFVNEFDIANIQNIRFGEVPILNLDVFKSDFEEIVVYPNPVHSDLSIVSHNKEIISIEIMDTKGNVLKKLNTSEQTINTEDLPSGLYFAIIQLQDNTLKTAKFIKN